MSPLGKLNPAGGGGLPHFPASFNISRRKVPELNPANGGGKSITEGAEERGLNVKVLLSRILRTRRTTNRVQGLIFRRYDKDAAYRLASTADP